MNEGVVPYAAVGKSGPYSRAALVLVLASKNCEPAAT